MNDDRPAAERAPKLLLALIDAATKLGEQVARKSVTAETSYAPLNGANDTFELAQSEMIGALGTICQQAKAFLAIQNTRPTTIEQGLPYLAAAQEWYAQCSNEYLMKNDAWLLADAQRSRVRLRCVDILVEQHRDEAGWSRTRADKEASAHPDYADHKDYAVRLASDRAVAEVEMKLAEEQVRNARIILQTLVTGTQLEVLKKIREAE